MYLIGGENATGAKASITKLNFAGASLKVDTIRYMPVLIKDCGATCIDNKLYILGGVQNGKPDNKMYLLDLDDVAKPWVMLPACPEAPRLEPVVAAQKDASGQSQLYIWGGYVPRYGNQVVELSCEGYRYNPATKTWKLLPSPLDAKEARVYLGGGAVVADAGHQIIAIGGAGYEALRQSLVQMPADYWQHEPSWYAYNQNVFSYNADTNKWQRLGSAPDTARAHAGIALHNKYVYMVEGETKPGVCTSVITRLLLP